MVNIRCDDYGFDCQEASTGEEGLEMIEANPPDILLLDNKLPGMSGMEVLEIIQKRNNKIRKKKCFKTRLTFR